MNKSTFLGISRPTSFIRPKAPGVCDGSNQSRGYYSVNPAHLLFWILVFSDNKKKSRNGLKLYFLGFFHKYCYRFFSKLSPSPRLTYAKPVACKKGSKNKFVLSSLSDVQTSNIIFISALVQPDNHVVQTFDTQLSNEVIFSLPFLPVSPFMLLNLAR